MSLLRDEDARYHWSDGAHKWSPPDGVSEGTWRAKLMAHLDAHRESWLREIPTWARPGAVFRRGFVEEVRCTARNFLRGGAFVIR